MSLRYTDFPGTGNSKCFTPKSIMVELNNKPLNQSQAQLFSDQMCKEFGYKPVRWTFSFRKTKYRWGTAWPGQRRVTLYRHSVWVFLHELAHMLVPIKTHHSRVFGRRLDALVVAWNNIVEL